MDVPAGKDIDVLGPAEDDRFMVVSVDGERFHAFGSDLLALEGAVCGTDLASAPHTEPLKA